MLKKLHPAKRFGSFVLDIPAAPFLKFLTPENLLSIFFLKFSKFFNSLFLKIISPRTKISSLNGIVFGTKFILKTFEVINSPIIPSPLVIASFNSPSSKTNSIDKPSNFSVNNNLSEIFVFDNFSQSATHFINSSFELTLFKEDIGILCFSFLQSFPRGGTTKFKTSCSG